MSANTPRHPVTMRVTIHDAPRSAAWRDLVRLLLAPLPDEPPTLRLLPATAAPPAEASPSVSGDDDATTGSDAA
jgi:hypothetical protein